jgi:hypothetical protein
MSDPHPQYVPTEQPRPLHAVFYYWGVAILLVGLVGAAPIYVFAADDGDTDRASEIASGRMYKHNLELMGGKFAVLRTSSTNGSLACGTGGRWRIR